MSFFKKDSVESWSIKLIEKWKNDNRHKEIKKDSIYNYKGYNRLVFPAEPKNIFYFVKPYDENG